MILMMVFICYVGFIKYILDLYILVLLVGLLICNLVCRMLSGNVVNVLYMVLDCLVLLLVCCDNNGYYNIICVCG